MLKEFWTNFLSEKKRHEAQRHKNYQFSKQPSLFGLLIISQQTMQVNKWIGISPCCSLLSAAIALAENNQIIVK